ncbi:MAG: hypothetical protein ACREBU_13310, partial [Nitrososphaera sp.]
PLKRCPLVNMPSRAARSKLATDSQRYAAALGAHPFHPRRKVGPLGLAREFRSMGHTACKQTLGLPTHTQ